MFSSQPRTFLKDKALQYGKSQACPGGSSVLATYAVSLEPFTGGMCFWKNSVAKTQPQPQGAKKPVGETPNVIGCTWLEGKSSLCLGAQKRRPSLSLTVDWRTLWEGGRGQFEKSGVWKGWELGRVNWSL